MIVISVIQSATASRESISNRLSTWCEWNWLAPKGHWEIVHVIRSHSIFLSKGHLGSFKPNVFIKISSSVAQRSGISESACRASIRRCGEVIEPEADTRSVQIRKILEAVYLRSKSVPATRRSHQHEYWSADGGRTGELKLFFGKRTGRDEGWRAVRLTSYGIVRDRIARKKKHYIRNNIGDAFWRASRRCA